MLREEPFTYETWADVSLQGWQAHEAARPDVAECLARDGAMTALVDEDGHTVACGGLYPVGPGQAVAITYIGSDAGPYMTQMVRLMRRTIRDNEYRWPVIRAACLQGFAPGRRLLELLGFRAMMPTEPVAVGARVYDVMQRVSHGRN